MSKKTGTKNYSREFREKAVKLVTERGYTLEQVAQQLECSPETIRRWKERHTQQLEPEIAQRIANDEDEFKRLRKEVAQLKLENEILKKAAAYFAKEVM